MAERALPGLDAAPCRLCARFKFVIAGGWMACRYCDTDHGYLGPGRSAGRRK